MSFPEFFDRVPPITVIDPLGRFLGAGDGVVTHHYAEAVKLAGHSCPTLAGSWLMLRAGLARLWPGGLPVRGDIHVHLPNEADEGTTGVVAAVASLVTGARGDDGFKGLAGRFDRRGRLHFGTPLPGGLGLRRADNGAGVALGFEPAAEPSQPELRRLLGKWVDGAADAAEERQLGQLWQDRVRRMLIDRADDPSLIQLADWPEQAPSEKGCRKLG